MQEINVLPEKSFNYSLFGMGILGILSLFCSIFLYYDFYSFRSKLLNRKKFPDFNPFENIYIFIFIFFIVIASLLSYILTILLPNYLHSIFYGIFNLMFIPVAVAVCFSPILMIWYAFSNAN